MSDTNENSTDRRSVLKTLTKTVAGVGAVASIGAGSTKASGHHNCVRVNTADAPWYPECGGGPQDMIGLGMEGTAVTSCWTTLGWMSYVEWVHDPAPDGWMWEDQLTRCQDWTPP